MAGPKPDFLCHCIHISIIQEVTYKPSAPEESGKHCTAVQVSDVVAEKLSASQKTEVAGKPSKAAAMPLQDLFAVGQLVRCSVVALHDKDSSDGMPHPPAPNMALPCANCGGSALLPSAC